MRKISIIICLLAITCVANAQKDLFVKTYPAEVLLKDGTTMSGYTAIPKKAKKITLKTEDGQKTKIESVKIKTLIIDEGKKVSEYEYHSYKILEVAALTGKIVSKVKNAIWMPVINRGDKATLYKCFAVMQAHAGYGGGPGHPGGESIQYYCLKENEETPTLLWTSQGLLSGFSKTVSFYFADCPELSQKIADKAKGYKRDNLEAIVHEYNACK